jgi:hypothetical protein
MHPTWWIALAAGSLAPPHHLSRSQLSGLYSRPTGLPPTCQIGCDGGSCIVQDGQRQRCLSQRSAHALPRNCRMAMNRLAGASLSSMTPRLLYGDRLPRLVVDRSATKSSTRTVSFSPKEQSLFELLYQNAGRCAASRRSRWWSGRNTRPVYDYQIERLVNGCAAEPDPQPCNGGAWARYKLVTGTISSPFPPNQSTQLL